ncbi:aldose epimerase family protein [Mycolicibacterium sp. CBM1]
MTGGVRTEPFGVTRDGTPVQRAVLVNRCGMSVAILSYGGIVQTLEVPGHDAQTANVVLGFDDFADYEADTAYFGAIVGRCANRIGNATFQLDGVRYRLNRNDEFGTMHGGAESLDKRVWDLQTFDEPESCGVLLTIRSDDGDNGFPGALTITACYELLRNSNVLRLSLQATTDAPTVVNLTGHSYFNLAGEGSGSVANHLLKVEADAYLPVTPSLVPTGEYATVDATPFDFRDLRPVGERVRVGDEQLRLGRGYDHNYVLRKGPDRDVVSRAAQLVESDSGRVLEVWTTAPGLDVYTGNFLDGSVIGRSGRIYRQGDAIALEPEHFADSPNQPKFPSVVLRPGETYRNVIEYRFGLLDLPMGAPR